MLGRPGTQIPLVLLRLEGVESATQGDMLRGKILYLARKDAKLPEGRYFIQDLIGMQIQDAASGQVYGQLQEVFQTGANDVYRIVGENGREYLFPAVGDMIAETNLEEGVIRVRPIPGILRSARLYLLTLFPDMCEAVMAESIVGRARKKGYLQVCCHQIRDYAYDKHQRVDDCPFGGGKGMLLMAEPIALCIDDLTAHLGKKPHMIYMSPQGSVLNQQRIKELGQMENIAILCGHYEGVDERLLDAYVDEQISLGDFVLTGGELPALALADAVSRMVKGVLAEDVCFEEESHYNGLLEYPHYTRPAVWRGREVPPVLLSGHHANIAKWRRAQSLWRTLQHRPDMLEQVEFEKGDADLLYQMRHGEE